MIRAEKDDVIVGIMILVRCECCKGQGRCEACTKVITPDGLKDCEPCVGKGALIKWVPPDWIMP